MRLKLLTIGIMLTTASNLVFASTTPHHHYRAHNYKGYKGEIIRPLPPAPCSHYAFGGGPYVGFSLGARTNYSSNPSAYKSLEAILSAGWGAVFMQRYYLAGEILLEDGATLQNYTNNNNGSGINSSPKSTWNYGLSVLPGYLITDNILGYLRLGVLRTDFTNASSYATGGQVGVGFETTLDENWDLRGEYDYDFYKQASGSSLGNVKSDQFNLGLVYKIM